ncbi:CAP domain-containing protein [Sporodiniella umbellata]|nr:CAP domain-containing protein [Sporodiniella umbellata]
MSFRTFTVLLAIVAVVLCTFVQTAQALSPTAIQGILAQHNKFRAKHHAPALKWNRALASYAQKWSNGCQWRHSQGPYGENLALGYRSWEGAIDGWYSEVTKYNYNNPGFGMSTGHFTQLVWKATTEIGCGVTNCPNLGSGQQMYTCSYKVPGNMMGNNNMYFRQNVLAP